MLLLCYLAPYINPADLWPLAFFSMAFMPILFVNAVFLVYWLIMMRKLALISGCGILLGSGLITHNIGFHKQSFENDKASLRQIRVMTYNVYDFLDASQVVGRSTDTAILKLIGEQRPDIVNMQEFFTHSHERFVMVDSIRKVMGARYYWFRPLSITPFDTTGLVTFSKYPIIRQDTVPKLNGVTTEGMFVDVKKDDKIFRVYNFHLRSTSFSRDEDHYLDSLSQHGEPDVQRSKHIGSKLKHAFMIRGRQVTGIKQLLAKCPYPYIITGDFNDTPLSFTVNHMSKGLKNAFCEKGYGLGVTFYGVYPGFQLDYILASPQFEVASYKILHQRLSDHYPVLSDVELK